MAAITTAVIAAAGVGMAAYGNMKQTKIAKQQAAVQQQMFQEQQEQEGLRREAMNLDARRKTMEAVRNMQRARSQALAAANVQGARGGSGLQGGYGQISGQTGVGITALQENLALGNQMFDSNIQMSQYQQQLAGLGSSAATARGWSSLGGTLVSNAGTIGNISKGINFGSSTPGFNQGIGSRIDNYSFG